MNLRLTTLASLILCTQMTFAIDDPLLRDAEKNRGVSTGESGIKWRVDVESKTGTSASSFIVWSQDDKIYAEEVVESDESKIRKYVSANGKMWFSRKGLSRPVPVNKVQRLRGDAAIGDIASTSYVEGYTVESAVPSEIGGEKAVLYTLRGSLFSTYATIKYWITQDTHLGKKAEFYSRTGGLLRTSVMSYDNKVEGKPFLSKMEIDDSGRKVVLLFSEPTIGQFPEKMFTMENLNDPDVSTINTLNNRNGIRR